MTETRTGKDIVWFYQTNNILTYSSTMGNEASRLELNIVLRRNTVKRNQLEIHLIGNGSQALYPMQYAIKGYIITSPNTANTTKKDADLEISPQSNS